MERVSRERWAEVASRIPNWELKLGPIEDHEINGGWYIYNAPNYHDTGFTPCVIRVNPIWKYDPSASRERLGQIALEEAAAKEATPIFGEGLGRDDYMKARILLALEIAAVPGTDGPHDGGPLRPANPEWEKEASDAILEASLEIHGRIIARDKFHTGIMDDLARLLGYDVPPPDWKGRQEEELARWLDLVYSKLQLSS